MQIARKKVFWNNPFVIGGVALNLFFVGNTLLAGWSLIWPMVTGTVNATDIIETTELNIKPTGNYYLLYLLQLTYTYEFGSTEYGNTVVVDKFDSRRMCIAGSSQYKDKIKVYVNPLNPKVSTINPGSNFANALIINILLAALTTFLFLVIVGTKSINADQTKTIAEP